MIWCKHEWEILSEKITESQLEHYMKVVKLGNIKSMSGTMAERKLIQILTCNKCGKLKRFVEVL